MKDKFLDALLKNGFSTVLSVVFCYSLFLHNAVEPREDRGDKKERNRTIQRSVKNTSRA